MCSSALVSLPHAFPAFAVAGLSAEMQGCALLAHQAFCYAGCRCGCDSAVPVIRNLACGASVPWSAGVVLLVVLLQQLCVLSVLQARDCPSAGAGGRGGSSAGGGGGGSGTCYKCNQPGGNS